ncbi:MAG TPA: DUF6632 domain-containing protein [Sphingomicrobium sp.]|jgi:hypothetical protein|nr:DUF6632 domain-containing protein [Sphingomicrobium sp.]
MSNNKLLSYALIVFGLAFCLIYPLAIVWPSGWAWHSGPPASNDYYMMIVGVYATLGVFMILASRDPAANRSLIWFVVWSSIVHALVMAWEAMRNPAMSGHLTGDVPALLLIAIVLGYLMMSRSAAGQPRMAG